MRSIEKIEKVKRWLMDGKSLTRLQCWTKFNYSNLPDAVYVLINRGMDIRSEWRYKKKDGKVVSKWKVYYLNKSK